MPKPPQEIVDRIESGDADGTDRSPVPDGFYLLKVLEAPEVSGDEFDMVNFKFEVQSPRGFKGKWLWDRFSYNPRAAFKWKNLYDATGYEYSTDTDELVEAEELVVAKVSQGVIEKGKRKGEIGNNIDEYFEPSEENRALCTG